MKIRNSHVTNSSSSSFVVSVKHYPILGPEYQYPFIKKAIDNLKSLLKHAEKATTREGLVEWYCESWECTAEELPEILELEGHTEEFDKKAALIERGLTIHFFDLDWNEDLEEQGILKLFKEEEWLIIEGEF